MTPTNPSRRRLLIGGAALIALSAFLWLVPVVPCPTCLGTGWLRGMPVPGGGTLVRCHTCWGLGRTAIARRFAVTEARDLPTLR